ncbi:MAG: zinc-finger domain-containing protein [Gammaproteobacteria bacterium]|nr:zinc-finger domain-containing protein [Gammaproteobacteria bacterium]MCY4219825.1 zinc-finger domain-containing protein [Gammaproteobacteria bacterium]MCY4275089.1 zinc-finger domain-containing protein [Gammaproteobacteria bacterium]
MECVSDVPNAHRVIRVTRNDLPLHCPMPNMRLWDSHPKVFLPIGETGRERCPYCGTLYILEES